MTGVALAPKLLGWMGAAPSVIATGTGQVTFKEAEVGQGVLILGGRR